MKREIFPVLVVFFLSNVAITLGSPSFVRSNQAGYTLNHSVALNLAYSWYSGLSKRQQETCTLPEPWIDCGNGICCSASDYCISGCGCCPQNYQCCSDGACCPNDSKCYPNGKCCPNSAKTCNKGFCLAEGETCCGYGACEAGAQCMTSRGGVQTCCQPGESACDDGRCCEAGTECASDGLCVETVSSSSKVTKSQTAQSSAKPAETGGLSLSFTDSFTYSFTESESATESAIETVSLPSPTTSEQPMATCKPSGISNNVARDTDFGDYILVNGECLPVMDFVYLDGLTEELIESMCAGIQSQNWPGRISNSMMVLTKRGYRKQTPNCPGDCPERTDPRYNERIECDEFPFGSTMEGGGSNAHTMCIVWWQNKIQGALIRQYNRLYNIQTDGRFVVRILPSCDVVSPSGGSKKRHVQGLLERRQSELPSNQTVGNETILSSSYNKWVQDAIPGAPNGMGNIFAPFGGVNPGLFNTQLHLQGSVAEMYVIDGDGIEYSNINAPVASEGMNFTVPESDDLSIVAPALHNASVNISYTATVKALPSNSTAAHSASSQIYDDWTRTLSTLYLAGAILVIWGLMF